MGCGCCSCQCTNAVDTLTAQDDVLISRQCRSKAVEANYFLSRLVDNIALTKDGNNLTVTLTFADNTTKSSTVSLV